MIGKPKPLSAAQASDMATVLAMPARPSAPAPMPAADMAVRLKTSPLLRRLIPTPVALKRATRRAQRLCDSDDDALTRATAAIAAVVAGTARAGDIDALARRHLVAAARVETLQWHPWPTPRTDARSATVLRDAVFGGRGVVLSACHLGPFFCAPSVLAPLRVVPFTVAGPWFFEPPPANYWGRRLVVWQRRSKSRMVLSTGSFPILLALLERGDTVYLFFDLPGSHRTEFLGKPVHLADGTARLAWQSRCLVVPVRTRLVGNTVRLDADAPLDPDAFAGPDQLHAALAARHERWILETPEEFDDPATFGWGHGATPTQWLAPAHDRRADESQSD